MKENNKRRTGNAKEEAAVRYLLSHGYTVLERNYYSAAGEIDIIAREGLYLVFIEVKYRSTLRMGAPEEAVGIGKMHAIIHTARYYMLKHGISQEAPCRFDVVAILGDEIHLIKDAFTAIS